MFSYRFLLIYGIFSAAATQHETTTKQRPVGKSVNIALETVFEFNDSDHGADLKFLDNVQRFIGKVKTVIDERKPTRKEFSKVGVNKFTDFIHNAIKILNKFEDPDLEDFFKIFNDEIKKYHYRGCKFHELAENLGMRKYIGRQLDLFKTLPASEQRDKIIFLSTKMKDKNYKNERDFLDFINSLYRKDHNDFYRFLGELDDYRRNGKGKKAELEKIIKNGIKVILFNHYSQLNRNARIALKSKIDEYWEIYKNKTGYFSQTKAKIVQSKKVAMRAKANHTETKKNKNNTHANNKEQEKVTRTPHSTKASNRLMYIDEEKVMKQDSNMFQKLSTMTTKLQTLTFKLLYPKFVSDLPKAKMEKTSESVRTMITQDESDEINLTPRIRGYDSSSNSKEMTTKQKKHVHKTTKGKRSKTTTEGYTMRQMYVEKNLDLKYDPYAYDNLTTADETSKKLTKIKSKTASKRHKATSQRHKVYSKAISKTLKTTLKRKLRKKIKNTLKNNKNKKLPLQTLWYESIEQSLNNLAYMTTHGFTDRLVFPEIVTVKPYSVKQDRLKTMVPTKTIKYEINSNIQFDAKEPSRYLFNNLLQSAVAGNIRHLPPSISLNGDDLNINLMRHSGGNMTEVDSGEVKITATNSDLYNEAQVKEEITRYGYGVRRSPYNNYNETQIMVARARDADSVRRMPFNQHPNMQNYLLRRNGDSEVYNKARMEAERLIDRHEIRRDMNDGVAETYLMRREPEMFKITKTEIEDRVSGAGIRRYNSDKPMVSRYLLRRNPENILQREEDRVRNIRGEVRRLGRLLPLRRVLGNYSQDDVLSRILNLENELNVVKSQLKEDIEIIKDLNKKVQEKDENLKLREKESAVFLGEANKQRAVTTIVDEKLLDEKSEQKRFMIQMANGDKILSNSEKLNSIINEETKETITTKSVIKKIKEIEKSVNTQNSTENHEISSLKSGRHSLAPYFISDFNNGEVNNTNIGNNEEKKVIESRDFDDIRSKLKSDQVLKDSNKIEKRDYEVPKVGKELNNYSNTNNSSNNNNTNMYFNSNSSVTKYIVVTRTGVSENSLNKDNTEYLDSITTAKYSKIQVANTESKS